jgi:hypothetical protein
MEVVRGEVRHGLVPYGMLMFGVLVCFFCLSVKQECHELLYRDSVEYIATRSWGSKGYYHTPYII